LLSVVEKMPVDFTWTVGMIILLAALSHLKLCCLLYRVFFKHRENYFIPAYAQGIAMAVVQMPVSFLEVTLFSLIIYFMVRTYCNFSKSRPSFFKH
jgi:hypothetical protein